MSRRRIATAALLTILLTAWTAASLLGCRTYAVLSDSMTPTLRRGDLIVVRETPPAQIRVGDIVAYRSAGAVVVHRVITVRRDAGGSFAFVTKGDAPSLAEDPPFPAERLLGRVCGRVPLLGGIVTVLGRLWPLCLLAIPLWLLCRALQRRPITTKETPS